MHVDWLLTGCDEQDEREIERIWESERQVVEARLENSPGEPNELQISLTHGETPAWHAQAALHLPGRTLVAEGSASNVADTLEAVVAGLAIQINEVEASSTRKERRRRGLKALAPSLEESRANDRGDLFFAFLRPVMRTLERHARRELEILETEDVLNRGDLEVDDVIDETMVRAWERFAKRPADIPLDLWMIRLFDDVIADLSSGRFARVSLEERRPTMVSAPNKGDETQGDEWVEQAEYDETVSLADLLPGHEGMGDWDDLDDDARHLSLTRLLSQLTREQRHALILHAADGYETADIAQMQDRPPAAVQADIDEARTILARRIRDDDPFAYEPESDLEARSARGTRRHGLR